MKTGVFPWQPPNAATIYGRVARYSYEGRLGSSKWQWVSQWVHNSCVHDNSWTVWPIFFTLGTLAQDTKMKNCINVGWPWANGSRSNRLISFIGLWVPMNLACIQYWYQFVHTFVLTNRYQLNIWLTITHKVVTLITESLVNDLDQIGNMHMFFLLVKKISVSATLKQNGSLFRE